MKYTDRGEVTLRHRYRGQVSEFEICDTGIGIATEDLSRIFEPFERGTLPASHSAAGTGLGLTITKLLTEIMGGEISVNSTPGNGSIFKVRLLLPEAPAPLPSPIERRQVRGYAGHRITILAADDDMAHLDLLRDILTPLDFTLFCAFDGHSALTMADEAKPQAFLLDISMPGMNGWEVARALRRNGHDDATIIMVSANVDEAKAGDDSADHDAFIVKPIDVGLLLETLRQQLGFEWSYGAGDNFPPISDLNTVFPAAEAALATVPSRHHLDELHQLGLIGYVRGIEAKLGELEESDPQHIPFVTDMRALVKNFELKQYMSVLEALRDRSC